MSWEILFRISAELEFCLKDCSEFLCVFLFFLTCVFSPRDSPCLPSVASKKDLAIMKSEKLNGQMSVKCSTYSSLFYGNSLFIVVYTLP